MSVQLMAQVWELKLPHAELLVALALADHGNDDGGSIYPSVGRVAWMSGYSARQVRRILRRLEAGGLLVKVAQERGSRAAEYRLDLTAGTAKPAWADERDRLREVKRADKTSGGTTEEMPSPNPHTGGHVVRPREDIFDSEGGHFEHQRADIAVSAEPSVEPSLEPSSQASNPLAATSTEPPSQLAAGSGEAGEGVGADADADEDSIEGEETYSVYEGQWLQIRKAIRGQA